MHITLIISSLSPGGAEKVMAAMANYWAGNNQDITLITFDSRNSDSYIFNDRIKRHALELLTDSKNILESLANNYKRIKRLRSILVDSKPDIIISFIDKTNILAILSNIGLKYPLIICERVNPRKYRIGRFWRLLQKMLYPLSDALVVQTEATKLWFKQKLKFPEEKTYVIPNPVIISSQNSKNIIKEKLNIISMGRLVRQKGFDILLDSFSKIAEKYPDWTLTIIGKGEEENNLKSQAKYLGIEKQVIFTGFIKNPFEYLQNADLFVMPSRFEGFPNALIEAMSYGLAAISFNCPSGPSDIIRNGTDGILVNCEDTDGLTAAMDDLMSNKEKRGQFSKRAREVSERFKLEKIIGMWNNLLEEVIRRKK